GPTRRWKRVIDKVDHILPTKVYYVGPQSARFIFFVSSKCFNVLTFAKTQRRVVVRGRLLSLFFIIIGSMQGSIRIEWLQCEYTARLVTYLARKARRFIEVGARRTLPVRTVVPCEITPGSSVA